jgi:hypothetical protein
MRDSSTTSGTRSGSGKIAVIMRVLLGPHRRRLVGIGVPEPGFLDDRPSGTQDLLLPRRFVGERFLQAAEAVHVLYFDLGTQFGLTFRPQGNVGVAAQGALFHVAIAHFKIFKYLLETHEVGVGFLRTADIGFAHDLDERRTAAVDVEERIAGVLVVDEFSRVFFQVDAGDADGFFRSVNRYGERTADADRHIVLGNLVSLGEVGIEIIFPGENRFRRNGAPYRKSHPDRHGNGLAVDGGQRAGQPEADRTTVGVRRFPERHGTAAEQFCFCQKLGMHFEPRDHFVFHHTHLFNE